MATLPTPGTHVIEDITPLSVEDFNTAFNILPATALATNTVAGVAYPDSIIRNAANYTVPAAPARNYFAAWNALVQADQIQNGSVTLVIMPRDLGTAGDPTTARRVIIRAVTQWRESARERQVALDITKLNTKIF